jgi:cation diffusion facilitator CzcD-associated flavoprotein CzcO
VERLHLFQRTPPWVMPRANPPIPEEWQLRFDQHPNLQRALHAAVFSLFESFHAMFTHPRLTALSERRARKSRPRASSTTGSNTTSTRSSSAPDSRSRTHRSATA